MKKITEVWYHRGNESELICVVYSRHIFKRIVSALNIHAKILGCKVSFVEKKASLRESKMNEKTHKNIL